MIRIIHTEGKACNKVEEWKVNQFLNELEKDETEYIVGIDYCKPDGDYSCVTAFTEEDGKLVFNRQYFTEDYLV